MLEENSEIKIPTTWTDGNADVGRVREEKSRREKVRVREDKESKECEKVPKVAQSRNTMFFQCFVAPEGRKVD